MPRIFVLSGPNAGDRFDVAAGATFGRANECAVMLRDASVSRMHARLEHDAGGWTVVDTGSRNGLFVDGKRVERASLVDAQEFTLGEVLLRFRADAALEASSGAPASRDRDRGVERARAVGELGDGAGDARRADSSHDVGRAPARHVEPARGEAPAPVLDAQRSSPPPSRAPAAPPDDEIELEGAWDDAPAPAASASASPSRTSAPLEGPRSVPTAPSASADAPVRTFDGAALPRGTSSGIGARAAGAAAGITGRDRGILQYHKVEDRRGLLAADLGQQPLWLRALVVVVALGLFALVFWFVFRGTTLLKGDRSEDAETSAPSAE